ncbi:hypothetical protein [Campylobacter hyointestinalis]|uniref:hypothetical protein n=1 Tax=Campylobacter hyointestinalis TaxID=198 RepID=UPI0025523905|nr:hypothetical protein [Campylobacter hyointestinalis]MDL2346935.1 hypothetical protein [Campylobacter hyointestinalis]MDL2348453.1 hypothetical protein [Campylobacter hyointestinalis]MDL2350422.1 hypothetical protein [Campylobacter hyointestinalis]MDM1026029.1 hypothetical protein [Campylobacter hyointestinalis]MDM1027204.1 hypothetical protein [Campylobacter hyointestinalis]
MITNRYYTCPDGGTFDPDTKTCKICNEGDELNSSGMCYTDCTKYDFKNGVIKIGFSDGTCADCSTSKNYNDLYKCLCSFSGSSFSNSGAFVGDNKGSNYANCDNGTQIRTPDNVFDDKPTEPKNPDKPTEPANPDKPINPGSGSSGGDITDPKPVPGGSGSVTTDPGDKPDGSDPKPDDKPKDPDNNNPGGGSPSADDILGKPVDYSGTLKEYSDKLEEINNKFSEGIKTVSDSLQSFKENYLSLIDVLGGGVNSINKKPS